MMESWKSLLGDPGWLVVHLLPLAAAASVWLLCAALFWAIGRTSAHTGSDLGGWLRKHLRRPCLLLAPALALRVSLPAAALTGAPLEIALHSLAMLIIVAIGWLLIALTSVLNEFLDQRFVLDIRDNLTARRVHTKFLVLRRVLVIAICVVTSGGLLMTFPAARHLGAGLLASAGIVGLVLGIAARPTVEALMAGVQLALTEPIRVDDVVIVEGEWGRIEEIGATYVVVRIWDDRRLIVPVSHFLERAFQNWTRVTSDLLGQITLDVDYATPVEDVRREAGRIVEASPRWDRRFWNLQVVDAGERTIRLRVLVSAADASSAWDLRCEVREKLLGWLQTHHPEALPRLRTALEGAPTRRGPAPEPP
ncbi:MAG TPA: mechanosensitive ion channel domain-containing protein [Myxococcota bacterium]